MFVKDGDKFTWSRWERGNGFQSLMILSLLLVATKQVVWCLTNGGSSFEFFLLDVFHDVTIQDRGGWFKRYPIYLENEKTLIAHTLYFDSGGKYIESTTLSHCL